MRRVRQFTRGWVLEHLGRVRRRVRAAITFILPEAEIVQNYSQCRGGGGF